jgi:hypothetical protein
MLNLALLLITEALAGRLARVKLFTAYYSVYIIIQIAAP